MTGYRKLTDGLEIREGFDLGAIDALIFDIDGVVMDVSGSFRHVVCQTVQLYMQQILGYTGETTLVEPEEIKGFKLAGGFNSDWPITESLILFYLEKSYRYNTTDLATLRELPDDILSLTKRLKKLGGGWQAMEQILADSSHTAREWINSRFDSKVIIQIFGEVYAGERASEIYGKPPKYYHGPGLLETETVLIDSSLIHHPYGIITGRTANEAKVAFKQSGLQVAPQWLVTSDMGLEKPDPKTMERITSAMGFERAVFIGDTVDDFLTVQNYELKKADSGSVFFCGVESGALGKQSRETFASLGAHLIAYDVNCFLRYLQGRS